ncbi:hypothetical protein BJ875DRAFT_467901 [Amylocarpus encephaloides]|uniref:Uncharacterized protein n=1 Tax=Amylocarpus encephaloides TaxID=45428 RepID=A0A9P7YE62_9HELO|nr:hypothetical protein BJ875DRAFT_467901 [Amylocarpus encephaloides]
MQWSLNPIQVLYCTCTALLLPSSKTLFSSTNSLSQEHLFSTLLLQTATATATATLLLPSQLNNKTQQSQAGISSWSFWM